MMVRLALGLALACLSVAWIGCAAAWADVPPAYGYGRSLPGGQPVLDLSPWLSARAAAPLVAPPPLAEPPAMGLEAGGPSDAVLTSYQPAEVSIADSGQSPPRFTVQIGAFSKRENAEKLARRAESVGEARIEANGSGGQRLHRVRIGEYPSRVSAERALKQALNAGLAGTIIAIKP